MSPSYEDDLRQAESETTPTERLNELFEEYNGIRPRIAEACLANPNVDKDLWFSQLNSIYIGLGPSAWSNPMASFYFLDSEWGPAAIAGSARINRVEVMVRNLTKFMSQSFFDVTSTFLDPWWAEKNDDVFTLLHYISAWARWNGLESGAHRDGVLALVKAVRFSKVTNKRHPHPPDLPLVLDLMEGWCLEDPVKETKLKNYVRKMRPNKTLEILLSSISDKRLYFHDIWHDVYNEIFTDEDIVKKTCDEIRSVFPTPPFPILNNGTPERVLPKPPFPILK